MELKQRIIELAMDCGFHRAVIAGLQPMLPERKRYERWLDKGYAADMEYLKRNPEFRTTPQRLSEGAACALVVSARYYSEPPECPGDHFGKVANYAVGLDYHPVLRARLRDLRAGIEQLIGRPLPGKPFTDDVALYEQGFAAKYGLGFPGKNTLIIGPKLSGSYNFIAELPLDLELEVDEPYNGTCGQCFRCGSACPTGAITEPNVVDSNLCISYLTIENKHGIPKELREKLGQWVFGCDVCQEVCPYNQRPEQTTWPEFRPQAGVGHFLDLYSLLEIENDEQFRARFQHSPVRRPKRRGLLRNALVVLGNLRPPGGINRIINFARAESDPMLREHAAWALAKYESPESRAAVEQMFSREPDQKTRAEMAALL